MSDEQSRLKAPRYRLLLRYAIPYWRGWLLIVVVTLLSSAFALLTPWPMKILVDHVLTGEPIPDILAQITDLLPGAETPGGLIAWIAAAGVLIYAVNSAVDVFLILSWIRVGQRMVYDFARDLFAHIQRRSLLFHSRNSVGDLMSRVTVDSWCVYNVLAALLFTPGHALITAAAMIAVMAQMDVSLTILSLIIAPFMAGASVLFGRPIRRVTRERREAESRMQAHIQQTLTGIPVVQGFAREEHEHYRFREFAGLAIRAQRRGVLVSSINSLGSGIITTLGTATVLWFGAMRVLDGQLTVGSILVFLAYLGTLQAQLKALSGVYAGLQSAGASVDRVMEVLEAPVDVVDCPGAVPLGPVRGQVRLEGVSFGYGAERPVLQDISMEALPGQTIAIVGATGAGKSTLVGLLPRFFDPWQGRVLIDGKDVRDVQLKSLRNQISLVLQEPFLFPLSIAENIAYGRPDASREQIQQAARAANAHDFIVRLPEGYDTVIGERGATLSGGERQRISIARALLKDAPILILDEPTSALDAETEALLLEALERLMEGRTTLIIAHRLSTIRNADRIIVLKDGTIQEQGSHQELLQQGGAYMRLYRLQFSRTDASHTPGEALRT